MIIGVLALISSVFLLATFAVYISLPSLQNLHGKTLMCHVASLFFAYICLAINGLITIRHFTPTACKYLGDL